MRADKGLEERADSKALAEGSDALEAGGEACKPVSEKRAEPEANGSAYRGTWLLATSTSQPTYLALPYGISCLSWAGGMVSMTVAAAVTVYCNLLLGKLVEVGGERSNTYRSLAGRIMGAKHRWAYRAALAFQFVVIVGVGIANLILAGQCLQSIYQLYCGADCGVRKCVWQFVAGGALLILAQLPSMAHMEVVTLITTTFLCFYSISCVVLSVQQGTPETADYSVPGNTVNRVMNGFNAVGIVVFAFSNNIVPELAATLRRDPQTGSAYPTVRKAIFWAYSLIITLQMTVSAVGYWAYGNTVASFLIDEFTHPRALLVVMYLVCAIQLIVGEQVFEMVLYESWENWLVRKAGHRSPWLRKTRTAANGSAVTVPSRLCALCVRVPYVVVITFVAAAFPFFSDIMGLIGALGLTPVCFVFPLYMWMLVNGRSGMSAASYWAHGATAAVLAGAGLLATIGAVRGIVVAIQQHDFFS